MLGSRSWLPDGITPDGRFTAQKIHARFNYEWRDPAHELPYWTGRSLEEVAVDAPGLVLHHRAIHKPTRSNYLPLLKLGVEEAPQDARRSHYYGRELMFSGQWEAAVQELERHLSLPASHLFKEERSASLRYIAKCHQVRGQGRGWRAEEQGPDCITEQLAGRKLCGGHATRGGGRVQQAGTLFRWPHSSALTCAHATMPLPSWVVQELGQLHEAQQAALRGVVEFDLTREPWMALARVSYAMQDWHTTAWAAGRALAIGTVHPHSRFITDAKSWGAEPHDLAALAAFYLGDFQRAWQQGLAAAQAEPDNERLRTNLDFYKGGLDKLSANAA